jgi:hypothetical protein
MIDARTTTVDVRPLVTDEAVTTDLAELGGFWKRRRLSEIERPSKSDKPE